MIKSGELLTEEMLFPEGYQNSEKAPGKNIFFFLKLKFNNKNLKE